MDHFPVVYLTGAPAAGKSSVSQELERRFPLLKVFSYSSELRRVAAQRSGVTMTEDDIRRLSGQVIQPEDIVSLDRQLVDTASKRRDIGPTVIDSHAVTKELYGFRITAFDQDTLKALGPDCIVCLYTSATVTIERIERSARGRPRVSELEANMHTHLQCSVAVQYGILLGKPVYLVDSGGDLGAVVDTVAAKARLAG